MLLNSADIGRDKELELEKYFNQLDFNTQSHLSSTRPRPLSLRIKQKKERDVIEFTTFTQRSRDSVYLKQLLDRMNLTKYSIDQVLFSNTKQNNEIPSDLSNVKDSNFVFPEEHRRISTNSRIPVPKSYKTHCRKSESDIKIPQRTKAISITTNTLSTQTEPLSHKDSNPFQAKVDTQLKPSKRIQNKPAISNMNELMKSNQSISRSVNWFQKTPKSRLPLPTKFHEKENIII